MSKESVEKVEKLRNSCLSHNFEVGANFYLETLELLDKNFNGCGPDWMDEGTRQKLGWYLSFFEAAFLEHDFSFAYSDKTKKGFNASNKRLWKNCSKLIAARYSWWTEPISKSRRYLQARSIYRSCKHFGWSAWRD